MKKAILIGISIFIFGYLLITLFSSILCGDYPEYSYYYAIVFSILYLSAVVGVLASLILKELKRINAPKK
ncbi:MAG: hypothetical protein LIR50_02560 [Bacillota bacterium]|nr:hypothetical protein [Bacillota bacterium]